MFSQKKWGRRQLTNEARAEYQTCLRYALQGGRKQG